MIIYFEMLHGCGIREFKSVERAESALRREYGTYNSVRVRKATKDDISSVKSMGGYVPERCCKV